MTNFYQVRSKTYQNDPHGLLIDDIEPPENGQRLLYDGHPDAPRGFGLRVTAVGTKAFILRYKSKGRDRRMTIGQAGDWTLPAARKKARAYARDIDDGSDIIAERKAERDAPTVAKIVDQVCREHFDKTRTGKASRSRLERYFVKAFRHTAIEDVRRADVRRLIKSVAKDTPREASLLLANIKVVFAWCEDEEVVEVNPVATLKAQKIDKGMKPTKRQRVLDDDEIRSFWNDAENVGMHRLTALALKVILVTGQRPGEVAGMRWSEIDDRIWTIPASRRQKTETAHRVYLTDTALALLKTAKDEVQRLSKRRDAKPGDLVFETRAGQSLRVDSIAQTTRRYAGKLINRNNTDFGHWRPHDLRRTMRTGLAAAGVPLTIAEIVIGHVQPGIVGVYDQHSYAGEIQTALETWERRLLAIVEGKPADNVVPFAREA